MSEQKLLGFIPARSGSRRLVNKNSLEFGGSTLIELSVANACSALSLSHVGFSTDSPDYLQLARRAGLKETYLRPDVLAGDEADVGDCVFHYLEWAEKNGLPLFSHVVLLQPTSPFRTTEDIESAISQWRISGAPGLVSVVKAAPRPELVIHRDEDSGKLIKSEQLGHYSSYVLDGAIYITPIDGLRHTKKFWGPDSAIFISKSVRYYDIDTPEEFQAAKALYEASEELITKKLY